MKYGYAWVSKDDPTPVLQLAALRKAGCKTVFKLSPEQLEHARELIDKGERHRQSIADLFKVNHTTLYRRLPKNHAFNVLCILFSG
jgi:DNA invertase Pin-like site-specific DNA recombinase